MEAAGIPVDGEFYDDGYGFFLTCINNTCSPDDWSWYWGFYMHKSDESAWTYMPVGLGPGGALNNFCWNRNYNSNRGHYCAKDGDVILLNATIGKSLDVVYDPCKNITVYCFANENCSDNQICNLTTH
ncbi:MAG: hypothetical protein ACK4YO_03815, partial [Candidatus Altarchaeaceae archaeon]